MPTHKQRPTRAKLPRDGVRCFGKATHQGSAKPHEGRGKQGVDIKLGFGAFKLRQVSKFTLGFNEGFRLVPSFFLQIVDLGAKIGIRSLIQNAMLRCDGVMS